MAGNSHAQPIYQAGQLRIDVTRYLHPDALEGLRQTVYGTAGVRYQHTDQQTKVANLDDPLFFQLWASAELVGMYCLDKRLVTLAGTSIPGYYGRYLTVVPGQSNQGYGRLLKQQAIAYVQKTTSSPFLFYSYIEQKNSRSLSISLKEGFLTVSTLRTYIFRRYTPLLDERFALATKNDVRLLKPQLEQVYQNYRLGTMAHLGYQNNYFVLKEGNHVVAGVQANPVTWRFLGMPGLKGWVMMNLLPLVSATRRFFNPARYTFVALEGVYLAEGRQDLLPVLLESVLAKLGLHSAMWQLDERDPLVTLLSSRAMGRLSGFQADVQTRVLVKAVGVPDGWLMTPDPVYVSSFDYS